MVVVEHQLAKPVGLPNIIINLHNFFGTITLLWTPPGRRPGTAVGGERARPGGGHSIFLLIHDLHI